MRAEVPVRPTRREGGSQVQVAERPVLVHAQDEADGPVVEVELAVVRPPFDGHDRPASSGSMVQLQR